MNTDQWLIWSNKHSLWWAPDEQGYTPTIEKAGRYTLEQACAIVTRTNGRLPAGAIPSVTMILDPTTAPSEQFQVRATEGTHAVVSKTVREWREAYETALKWSRMSDREAIVVMRAATSGPQAGKWFTQYVLDDVPGGAK